MLHRNRNPVLRLSAALYPLLFHLFHGKLSIELFTGPAQNRKVRLGIFTTHNGFRRVCSGFVGNDSERRIMKTQRYLIRATTAIFALLVVGVVTPSSSWSSNSGADEFIRQVGNEAIQSLTDKSLDDQQRKDKFREILNRTFKIRLIARFTLGRNWRKATETERNEYVRLFEEFVVLAYAARFRDYSGEDFRVSSVRDINSRDKLVNSKLVLKDGRAIPVHWRVRGGEHYKIIDVLVEGVSMAITQRDEFAAIIDQNGGKVEGLLAALRKKTGSN